MQEAELKERIECLFASALAQTYQRDALIELYHILRQAWHQLEQSADQSAYFSALSAALQQIRSTGLKIQQYSQVAVEDQEIIKSILYQFAQLEGDAK